MSILLANMFGEFQWLFIALIVLLLFGNRLPSVMRSMGEGVSEFKKGIAGIDDKDAAKEPPAKLGDPSIS
jgi:sec-independent protein translocase protein TatA